MSGHSKWSTIKRQKGVADAKRSAVFTKLAKAITVAARQGGGDADMNFRLRLAVDKAREQNMPKENIDRAVAKGAGTGEGIQIEEVGYEGYGPGGVAFVINTVTDNRNRTVSEIRALLTRHGGTLGSANSVAWQFARRGVIRVAAEKLAPEHDALELELIEAGAEDVQDAPEGLTILTNPEQLQDVKTLLEKKSIPTASADIELVSNTPIPLSDADSKKLQTLIEILEDHADVTAVWTNAA